MLNILPKGIIINNIVDTLKKDPENGVVNLLETAKSSAKTATDRALISQVIDYYATSQIAKMQIRNLVFNTSKRTLYTFAEKVYDALSTPPIVLNFMRLMTIAEASRLRRDIPVFPVIDLKNLNDETKEVLAKLKNDGLIFFASIAVNEENIDVTTSDEVVLTLVKHGVRAIFYRLPQANGDLESKLYAKIKQIRTGRPILAFLMKKDMPNSTSLSYFISENVNGNEYVIRLNLG